MYDCIIFDVDGTLINTEQAVVSSYQRVIFEQFGRFFTEEEIFRNYSFPTNERMEKFGITNVEEAVEKFHKYLMEAFCGVKPYEGILQLLEILKQKKIAIGIVTARSKKEVDEDPCLQSIVKHFNYVICADDTIKHKPDPEPLLRVIKEMNMNIFKTLYIGDTHSDYMCAVNSDVDFGLALWGAKNTENIEAEYNFKEPAEILEYVSTGPSL